MRKFVQEEIVPRAREFDERAASTSRSTARWASSACSASRYDPHWGGAGLDWSYTAVLFEELGRCDNAGVAMGISVHTDMATPSLHQFGSDELSAATWCPPIKGEMVSAIAVTEPDAGSDVASIKTRAVRDGDDWVINGSKIYITNAATADWLCLLAVTDPEAGYGGFSQIIVPTDAPGFSYQLLDKIGNRGSDTGLLFFEDVRVPVANTIGEIGRGFQQQMMQFQDERLVACVSRTRRRAPLGGRRGAAARSASCSGSRCRRCRSRSSSSSRCHPDRRGARADPSCVRKRIAGEDATQEISHGEALLGRTCALRRRHVHPAPRRLRLHEGERGRTRPSWTRASSRSAAAPTR